MDVLEGYSVRIPAGYIFDGASTPKWLWSWLPPIGRYLPAALLHDYLYESHRKLMRNESGYVPVIACGMKRKEADKIFLAQMKLAGVGWRTRYTMYYAVRIFGGKFWNNSPS